MKGRADERRGIEATKKRRGRGGEGGRRGRKRNKMPGRGISNFQLRIRPEKVEEEEAARREREREGETGPKRIPLNPGISESFEQC